MRISYSIFSILILFSAATCNVKDKENRIPESKGVISDALVYTQWLDVDAAERNENSTSKEPETMTKFESLSNDSSYFYCYETLSIVKIEILGEAKGVKIFIDDKLFREDVNVDGSYNILGNSLGNNSTVLIKQNDSILYKFKVESEGCL